MSEEDISMSPERPVPLPKDVMLRNELSAVHQMMASIPLDSDASHYSIRNREEFLELANRENRLQGELLALDLDARRADLPEPIRDWEIEYGANNFSFAVRLVRRTQFQEKFVEVTRSADYVDEETGKKVAHNMKLGNVLQVPFLNTRDVSVDYGDDILMPSDGSALSESRFATLGKQLGNAAQRPFTNKLLAEPGVAMLSRVSKIETRPLHPPAQ